MLIFHIEEPKENRRRRHRQKVEEGKKEQSATGGAGVGIAEDGGDGGDIEESQYG